VTVRQAPSLPHLPKRPSRPWPGGSLRKFSPLRSSTAVRRSVSVFLPGQASVGPRFSGEVAPGPAAPSNCLRNKKESEKATRRLQTRRLSRRGEAPLLRHAATTNRSDDNATQRLPPLFFSTQAALPRRERDLDQLSGRVTFTVNRARRSCARRS